MERLEILVINPKENPLNKRDRWKIEYKYK
jgi:hypothetical protein